MPDIFRDRRIETTMFRQYVVPFLVIGAAGVGACLIAPLDNGASGTAGAGTRSCYEIKDGDLFSDNQGGVSLQIVGSTCVSLYDYSERTASPVSGEVKDGDIVSIACVHTSKPPAIEVITGRDAPSAAANFGRAFSVKLENWQEDHRGTSFMVPDCKTN